MLHLDGSPHWSGEHEGGSRSSGSLSRGGSPAPGEGPFGKTSHTVAHREDTGPLTAAHRLPAETNAPSEPLLISEPLYFSQKHSHGPVSHRFAQGYRVFACFSVLFVHIPAAERETNQTKMEEILTRWFLPRQQLEENGQSSHSNDALKEQKLLAMMVMEASLLVNSYRIRCMKLNEQHEENLHDHQRQMDS